MSVLRFVVISDLHAHPWAAFARGDGASNTRLRRTLEILRASLARAQALDCPWVFGGDVVHTAGYALNVVLAELTEAFRRFADVPKLAVWGNHDARGVGGRITLAETVWATLERAVPNLRVLDSTGGVIGAVVPHPITVRGITFSGAGAQPRPELVAYAPPSDVGVYHGTVRGSVGPNGHVFENGLDSDELLQRHRFVVCGDVHHPQQIDAPLGQAILVPGSPEHHNFGDVGEHGWWIVTLPEQWPSECEPRNPEVEFVPGGSPEFRTVRSPSDVRADGHFYRVLSAPAGYAPPANATVIAPGPTVVEARDALRGARGEEVLQAWLREDPPDSAAGPIETFLAIGRELLGARSVGQLQPMRLTHLRLVNFCSYAEQDLELRDGVRLVLGRGRDYPSNGAGKSTLFEAAFWLLFGRTTKGLGGDEVIRWGEQECFVSATFQDLTGKNVLHVRRERGEASRLEIDDGGPPWEAASVNEMTEKLCQRLGVTPSLFQALAYFSQERLVLFASATDGERKGMLADLIGLSAYQEAATAAQTRVTELELEAQRTDAFHQAAERVQIAETARLSAIRQEIAVWEDGRRRRVAEADAAYEEFVAQEEAHCATLRQEARRQLTAGLDDRERALGAECEELTAWLSEPRPTCTPESLAIARAQYESMVARTAAARSVREETDRQLVAMRRRLIEQAAILDGGTCPTCGQPITGDHRARCLDPITRDVRGLEEVATAAAAEQEIGVQIVERLKARVNGAEAGVEQSRQIAARAAALERASGELKRLAAERDDLDVVAERHVREVLGERRAALAAVTTSVRAERNPHDAEERATLERLASAEKEKLFRAEETARTKRERAIHEYWRRGFSRQGIQSLLMDEVAALFNAERGTIFPALTQGVYDVQLSATSLTKAGERRERTELVVLEHGRPIPYEALSGGQRRRIDVGVMLTLVKAVSGWLRVPGALGMLVLDEVFGFLDAAGAEGLVEALREVQAVVPAVYVVAHDPQLQALFSDTITVEQDAQGVSRVA